MPKKFNDLKKKLPREHRERAAARTSAMIEGMALADLRRAHALSQETLAKAMGLQQPDVSKLENRADTYVSTLRKYVEALGGSLEIIAHFREGDVRITQFSELAEATA